MSLAAVVLVASWAGVLVGQDAPATTWRIARRLEGGVFDHAECVAARGAWVAAVQEFPEKALRPQAHRPEVPWKLVRQAKGDVEELASLESARSGWGVPQWLAVGGEGTVVATWRLGSELLIAPPGQAARRVAVLARGHESEADVECAGLTPDWLFRWNRTSRELTCVALGPEGIGERRSLPGGGPLHPHAVRWDERWVAWVGDGNTLRWHDLSGTSAAHETTIATSGTLLLSGVFAGYALLYEQQGGERVHVVALASGETVSSHGPGGFPVLTPEGIFSGGWLHDPVSRSVERWEQSPGTSGSLAVPMARPRPGVLYVRAHRTWFELALDAPMAPIPEASLAGAAPPVLALDAEAEARRLAQTWREMRAREGASR